MREDRFRIPRGEVNLVLSGGYDFSSCFETRICSASVVGHRNAKLVKKSCTAANVYLMESKDEDMWHEKRK